MSAMPDSRSYLAIALGPDTFTYNTLDPNENSLDPLGNSCCICYHAYSTSVMYPGAEDPVQLGCGHVFGEKCLSKWLCTKNTCPLCRSSVRLTFQNGIDQTLDERLSYGQDFSWSHDVGYEMDADGESEAEDEFFDAQEDIVTPLEVYRLAEEDMWFTAAAYEENASWCTPVKHSIPAKPSFASFTQPALSVQDERFDEFVKCHEQWMADSTHDDESDDEDCIGYLDVFPR
jgi:hypothetical protein